MYKYPDSKVLIEQFKVLHSTPLGHTLSWQI